MIGRSLFKKETNLQLFVGLKVTLSTGETGVIEGGFGQSGKYKIRVQGKDYLRWEVTVSSSPLSHLYQTTDTVYWRLSHTYQTHCSIDKSPSSSIHTPRALSLSFLGHWGSLCGQFSGCGKSGRPDILSHIPRIPLGIASVPGEVCSVFILPSVAPNPLLHTGREEKTKTFRKRTSPTSSSLPHILKSL